MTTHRDVHVFGDSHVLCLMSQTDWHFHYRSMTMYRAGRDERGFIDLMSAGVAEGAVVVFVFGEIDVRTHLGRQRDQENRDVDEIIGGVVSRYLDVVAANRSKYMHIDCIICEVIAPTDQMNNPEVPFYGTLKDRAEICRRLNSRLREECRGRLLHVIDIYGAYRLPNGTFDQRASDGHVHIRTDCADRAIAALRTLIDELPQLPAEPRNPAVG